MRRARTAAAWRRSTQSERGFRLARVRAIEKRPLADIDEELSNGLTIICGLNGVGKTTLLRLIEATLGVAGRLSPRLRDGGTEGAFILSVDTDGRLTEFILGEEQGDSPPPVVLLDAFELCGRIMTIAEQSNFGDLLEGVEARDYTKDELEVASYVVGKHYETLRVSEIEEPGSDDEQMFPVFEARAEGSEYDFTAMGLGELAGLASLWTIGRVDPGTVLLVEEPETFLSSQATVALMDFLAETIHGRRLYCVVTTHSMEIVARAPLHVIRVLTATTEGIILRRPSTRAELEHMLGAYVGQARLLLVEDRMAQTFVTEILARYTGLWGQAVEVINAGGAGNVLSACERFPQSETLRLAGILDGDQDAPDADGLSWPVFRLPGGAPDEMLRDAALGNRELFANRLGREPNALDVPLQTVTGRDAHDWFEDLATALMLDIGAVRRAAIHCWLTVGANGEAAEIFVNEIIEALLV